MTSDLRNVLVSIFLGLGCTPEKASDSETGSPEVGESLVPVECTALPQTRAEVRYVVADAPAGGDGSAEHPFSTPTEALDAAEPDWEIRLGSGAYDEFSVDEPASMKHLSIIGCGPTQPEIRGGFNVLGQQSAALEDVKTSNLRTTSGEVKVKWATDVVLEEQVLTNEYDDLYGILIDSSDVTVEEVTIEDAIFSGIEVGNGSTLVTSGILLVAGGSSSAGLRVADSTIKADGVIAIDVPEAQFGVYLDHATAVWSADLSVESTTDESVRMSGGTIDVAEGTWSLHDPGTFGIVTWPSASELMIGSDVMIEIDGAIWGGIALYEGTTATISGQIEINSPEALYGISIWNGSALTLMEQSTLTVENVGTGLLVDSSTLRSSGSITVSTVWDDAIRVENGTVEQAGGAWNFTNIGTDEPTDIGACGFDVFGGTITLSGLMNIYGAQHAGVRISNGTTSTGELSLTTSSETSISDVREYAGIYIYGGVLVQQPGAIVEIADSTGWSALVLKYGEANLGGQIAVESFEGAHGIYTVSSNVAVGSDAEIGLTKPGYWSGIGVYGGTLEVAGQVTVDATGALYGVYAQDANLTWSGDLNVDSASQDSMVIFRGTIEKNTGTWALTNAGWNGFRAEGAEVQLNGTLNVVDSAGMGIRVIGGTAAISGAHVQGSRGRGGATDGHGISLESLSDAFTLDDFASLNNLNSGVRVKGATGVISWGTISGNAYSILQEECGECVELSITETTITGNDDDDVHLCE